MTAVTINLNNYGDIIKFNSVVLKYAEDIDMQQRHYTIDAKSLMGVMTFDLSKNVGVAIHSDDAEVIDRFIADMAEFAPVEE